MNFYSFVPFIIIAFIILQEEEARALEAESVRTAEGGDLDQAHLIIDRAINIAPNLASLYNNRAQVSTEAYYLSLIFSN